MEAVSPIVDVFSRLWRLTAHHALHITDLEETMTSLETKMGTLRSISNDVTLMVQEAEQKGMRRKEEVQDWLTRVEQTKDTVNQILQQYQQLMGDGDTSTTCLKTCHCMSAYKIGKKAAKTINIVTNLISNKGEFQEIAVGIPPSPVLIHLPLLAPTSLTQGLHEMPMEDPVGIESDLENVWDWIKDENVGIIGLFGMGGVGKTTLLKKINNELSRSGGIGVFDVAFWVVASKQASDEAIQKNIMEKLKIPYETWANSSRDEKSAMVYEILKEKKYILMLDDVWERLDLFERVGLPKPNNQNKSKIILTTRSDDICTRMKVDKKIKVTCLPWDKAWTLFEEHVGKDNICSHPATLGLAQMVAKECDGLPLALITIGRAMASRTSPSEWSHALQKLKEYPSEFPDFGKDVLPVLKFSYDSLADSTIKQCFVYCSLFPEDYAIENDKLVDLWMGEGYLKEHDVNEAHDHGYSIIEDLKRVCLLESYESRVKMHDVIRDMALWIASDYNKHNRKFLVLGMDESTRIKSNILDCREYVEKMSLWRYELVTLNSYSSRNTPVEMFKNSITCSCPRLSTLAVDLSSSSHILQPSISALDRSLGRRLFKFVPCLRVLDLSTSGLRTSSIPLEVEGISELIYLEYLNLSGLGIQKIPQEYKRLSKLRYLLMNHMKELNEFPSEIIFSLTELVVFRMDSSPLYHIKFMRGLDNLEKLQETSIYVNSVDSLEFFLKSEKLQKHSRFLKVENIVETVLKLYPNNMKNLQFLDFKKIGSKAIELDHLMVFNKLHSVVINDCEFLEELDFLAYAPSLQYLYVASCRTLQRLLCIDNCGGVVPIPVFSSLISLWLNDLSRLEVICDKPLTFPRLDTVKVQKCPKLQNPFTDMMPTNTNVRLIKGENGWWDSLGTTEAASNTYLNILKKVNSNSPVGL